MKSISRFLSILLALAVGVSCSSGDLGPTDPFPGPADHLIGTKPVPTLDTLPTTNLLLCSEQRYLKSTVVVGSKGGKIKVGSHALTIPAGALSANVTIVAEQLADSVNSVRFSPEGLRFAKPARLTLNYDNCRWIQQAKRVAYTDELLKVLELPRSVDSPKYDYVTADIDHFSRYAVAY